jgi:kynurenine formamidase
VVTIAVTEGGGGIRPTPVSAQLREAATNWGRWGSGDEIGGLNFLGTAEVLRGIAAVRSGRPFMLGIRMAAPAGDPVWPGRPRARRLPLQDKSTYEAGHACSEAGDEFADEILLLSSHGTTHTDALGHVWYDDTLYNGFPARSTIGRLTKASVLPLAQRGIVGRGVLLDLARLRGKPRLDRDEAVGLGDLLAAADRQRVEIERHDILILRTGWLVAYYGEREEFERMPFAEPGLSYSEELVNWFHEREIPALSTDTLGNELTLQPEGGDNSLLHAALMRNLGVVFTEMLWLEDLAADCEHDRQYAFLYVSAPLKVVGGSGAPTNPIAIK